MNDKYLKYGVEDFIHDDVFVNWILQSKNDQEWKSWIDRNPSALANVEEARRFIRHLKFKEEPFTSTQKDDLWAKIDGHTEVKVVPLLTVRRVASVLALAASIALLVFVILPDTSQIIETGDVVQIAQLPASSTVEILADSKLSYDSKNWDDARNLHLEGEAIFDVSKGVPFTVNTANGTVHVLGTKFTVRSRSSSFSVEVESGRVEVRSRGQQPQVLTAGMQVVKNPSSSVLKNIEKAEDGLRYYQFEKSPFEEVKNALESEYQINLEFDDSIKIQDLTGSFNSSDSLETALTKVLYPLNLDYSIEGKTIRLTPR